MGNDINKCSRESFDNESFIVCSNGKLSTEDYAELKRYQKFRKERYEKKKSKLSREKRKEKG